MVDVAPTTFTVAGDCNQAGRHRCEPGADAVLARAIRNDEIGQLIESFNSLFVHAGKARNRPAERPPLSARADRRDPVAGVLQGHARGVYIGANPAFSQFVGMPPESFIGKTVYDIAPADLAETYARADRELLETSGVQVYETSVVHADGAHRDVIFNKTTFTDAEGRTAGLIGAMLDISERKRAEVPDPGERIETAIADRCHSGSRLDEGSTGQLPRLQPSLRAFFRCQGGGDRRQDRLRLRPEGACDILPRQRPPRD